ncbi:hypothetical protein F5880DRAFT_1577260 [Lentinula raphanica]|nr:hypothetical protein F5880DRAFT_1577260 [Lentinula raphanica]
MGQRSVLITGCSAGGIGHAFVKEFHSRGLKVFATARRLESMSELEGLEGVNLLKLDVTDIESIRSTRNEVASLTGGKLDILVNNAGQALSGSITDLDMAEFKALLEVNYFAPMSMVKEFLPLLLASDDARIVQTSSISGVVHFPFNGAYNMSKCALNAFADALRIELAFDNIKVVNLVTGAVNSNIHRTRYLSDTSLYKPMEQLYTEKRKQMSKLKATPTAQYAQQVASEILRPNPRPWFWLAKMSSVSWFLNQFFPRTLLDRIMSKQFGLNVFSTQIKQRNPHRLSNQQRVVLITGCSVGGIGHALAEEFHSRGARVFATARRLESMRALEELGITTFELDVTSIESIRKVHDQVSQLTGGRLDILINNA